jgi:hypothetical protein
MDQRHHSFGDKFSVCHPSGLQRCREAVMRHQANLSVQNGKMLMAFLQCRMTALVASR